LLKFIGAAVGVVLFCWATVSAFSIFSELKFMVDGWTWSVDQVPMIKAVALAVGRYVSGVVGGYREFIHGLVAMLHLPRLPQPVYDVAAVVVFSIRRGRAYGKQISLHDIWGEHYKEWRKNPNSDKYLQVNKQLSSHFPIKILSRKLCYYLLEHPLARWRNSVWLYAVTRFVGDAIVYGGLVAAVISMLFGIDYLYRHFA
jgi:hypothetical protein